MTHDIARKLIELGLVVVPTLEGKHPGVNATAEGLTLEQIANREASGLPNKYNVIIGRTDLGLRSGIVDVETDGPVGEVALGDLCEQWTHSGPVMVTPSGSTHRFYRLAVPEDHEVNIGAGFLPKVDVPWQLFAVDGDERQWYGLDLPFPDAPGPLWERLVVPSRKRDVVAAAEWAGEDCGTPAAVAFLTERCDRLRAAPEGEWNNTLFLAARWAAELVAGGTLDPDFARCEILNAMDDENDFTALGTLDSGWNAGLANPRRLTEDTDPVNLVPERTVAAGGWEPSEDEALEAFLDGAVSRVSDVLSRPAVEWWPGLEGLLQKGVTSEIVGASGQGKSLWTLQHCVDLAQRGVRVLYCALEGQAGFNGRLRAQIMERCVAGMPETEDAIRGGLEENLLFYDLRVALAGGGVDHSVAKLRAAAVAFGIDIIVVDTLIRAAPGVDENDNAQMQGVVDAADLLRYRPQVSVWLLRHAGHDQNRGRGASSVYAALDNSVFIAPVGNHDGKDGRPLIVRVRADKVKDGRQAHGLTYRRHEHLLGKLHDGTDWTSVVFRPEAPMDDDQNADWTVVLDLIDQNTDFEDGTGMTAAQIKAATQWSTGKVGKVLKEATEAGRIARSKEGKGSFVYSR